MTVRTTLRERRTQETRTSILDAAFHLFAAQGYGQTSVDAIIAEAGLSKGAFYHHFDSKEALFRALMEDRQRRCLEQMANAVGPASSLREAIEALVTTGFEFYEADRDWVRLYFEFCTQATRDSFASEIVAASLRECRGVVAEMLKAGKATLVRADLDAEAAAAILTGMFDGIALHWAMDPTAVDLRKLAAPAADVIERFVSGQLQLDAEAPEATSRTKRNTGRRKGE